MYDGKSDLRFERIEPFKDTLWLSSPTMHGAELEYITEAYETNWMSTVGKNIDELERLICEKVGVKYAVALTCGTAALHLSIRLAAEHLYGMPAIGTGALAGHKVFCSDMTFSATVNPIAYEGGEVVFIDTEYDTWNMDPKALERAFEIYPDVKIVVFVHLYGTPGKVDEIKFVCEKYGALLIEDAAESLGALYKGIQTGNFGDYAVVSFNGNKIITGSSGGAFLTNNKADAEKIKKWSTQSREKASWYQHEELGYNYRMSNVVAGVVCGQMKYLENHIERKEIIYKRYEKGLGDLPVKMNPIDYGNSKQNFWLSCLLINREAMCENIRSEKGYLYTHSKGKTCPDEILDVLKGFNAEGRPLWKPMHMQVFYRKCEFVTKAGTGSGKKNIYFQNDQKGLDASADLFARGLCLPSDIKMTAGQQEKIIDIVHRCFE